MVILIVQYLFTRIRNFFLLSQLQNIVMRCGTLLILIKIIYMKANIFQRFFLSKPGIITSAISSITGMIVFTPMLLEFIRKGDKEFIILGMVNLIVQVYSFIVSIVRAINFKRGNINN